jgi:DNA-binding IclR family transcriptional regulator
MSPKTGSIGVPVMWRGRPVAAINMHYILSALLLDEVVARYLEPLQTAAAKIADGLTERGVNPLADTAVVTETGD